jgi:hypothetical protein
LFHPSVSPTMQHIPHDDTSHGHSADFHHGDNLAVGVEGHTGAGDRRGFRSAWDEPRFTLTPSVISSSTTTITSNTTTTSSNQNLETETAISTMTISNYDVLIDGSYEHRFKLMDDDHVGNKRFEVVLNLHRTEYDNANSTQNQEEMERIVGRIITIVCRQCIPRGRFLEKVAVHLEGEPEWMDLGEGILARLRVHQALGGDSHQHHYNDGGMSHHHDDTDSPTLHWAMTTNLSILPSNEHSSNNHNSNNHSHHQHHNDELLDDSSYKRRRRGSYAKLRRSISESMLFNFFRVGGGSLVDNTNHNTSVASSTSLYSEVNHQSHDFTNDSTTTTTNMIDVSPQDMDVIFSPARNPIELATDTGNPGNARFQVMINMHVNSFCSADTAKRHHILAELITTVHVHWRGRFLVQLASPRGDVTSAAVGGTHRVDSSSQTICQELTSDAAGSYIRSLLLQKGGMLNSSSNNSDDNNNRHTSNKSLARTTTVAKDRFAMPWFSQRSGLRAPTTTTGLQNPPDSISAVSVLRKTISLPSVVVHQHPPPSRPEDDNSMLRNAAIEDLKSKKKKRDLMARVMTRKK